MATSFAQMETEIYQKFLALSLAAEKVFPNSPFDPDSFSGPWVRILITNVKGKHAGMGDGPLFLYDGLIVFDIFTRENEGTGDAGNLADTLRTGFRNLYLGCVRTKVETYRNLGKTETGWWQHQVQVPFDFYDQ